MAEDEEGGELIMDAETLLAAGYREFSPTQCFDRWTRGFQKRFKNDIGTEFFLNFHEWEPIGQMPLMFDAQICCETATNGNVWATIKEDSLDLYERRARQIWEAVGGAYYEARRR